MTNESTITMPLWQYENLNDQSKKYFKLLKDKNAKEFTLTFKDDRVDVVSADEVVKKLRKQIEQYDVLITKQSKLISEQTSIIKMAKTSNIVTAVALFLSLLFIIFS